MPIHPFYFAATRSLAQVLDVGVGGALGVCQCTPGPSSAVVLPPTSILRRLSQWSLGRPLERLQLRPAVAVAAATSDPRLISGGGGRGGGECIHILKRRKLQRIMVGVGVGVGLC